MSFVQPSRSMFLKTMRFSRGCGLRTFGSVASLRFSFSNFAASSSFTLSLKQSSTMATGAVPQLARHSTNSIEYSPSADTAIGLPCSAFAWCAFSSCHFLRSIPAAAATLSRNS